MSIYLIILYSDIAYRTFKYAKIPQPFRAAGFLFRHDFTQHIDADGQSVKFTFHANKQIPADYHGKAVLGGLTEQNGHAIHDKA